MLAGPVFEFELLTTARRGRYYALRVGYALVLLLILWQMHQAWEGEFGETLTPSLTSKFAHATFAALLAWQEVLVLVLTPALVAGTVAAERQSKTLHYVMASPLTGVEVVLGKLLSRLIHVGICLAVGFPILSLLVLFGGVDPRLIAFGCAVAGTSAFFLAGLSLLVSVHSRRVRDALFVAYALEVLWLATPEIVRVMVPFGLGAASNAVFAANDWLLASSPLPVARTLFFAAWLGWGGVNPVEDLAWMAAIQGAAGLAFVAVAAWQVRPAYRRLEGGPARSWFGGSNRSTEERRPRRRLFPRPDCGDRPMDWKERHTSRSTRLTRVVSALFTLAIGLPIVYRACVLGAEAFRARIKFGYVTPQHFTQANWVLAQAPYQLHSFLQTTVGLLTAVGLVVIGGAAAASVSSEHEDDTWASLTSTDLSAREILLSKMAGALWGARRIAAAIGLLTALGIAAGAAPWVAAPAELLALGSFAWFAAALGVWVSLNLRSTWRAQFLTLAVLLLVNLVGQAALFTVNIYGSVVWPGFMPAEAGRAVFGPDFYRIWKVYASQTSAYTFWPQNIDYRPQWAVVLLAASTALYASLAALLTWAGLAQFHSVAGRASRPRKPHAAAEPASAPADTPAADYAEIGS